MGHTKTSITLPEDLLEKARGLSDNLSALVADALRDYIRAKSMEKAAAAFGSWEEREASQRRGDSVDIVNELRKDERDYADRSD